MTSHRPYRAALSGHEALAELERFAGTQFDPDVVRLVATAVRERLQPPAPSRSSWRYRALTGPVAQWIERQTSNLRAEVRLLPGPITIRLRRTAGRSRSRAHAASRRRPPAP